MSKEELNCKIKDDNVIKFFHIILGDKYSNLELVGGAVIDILDGIVPKDYDFIKAEQFIIQKFIDFGFVFEYDTKTSITYSLRGITVQFLKAPDTTKFDFRISCASYRFYNKDLSIDEVSYSRRLLIPNSYDNIGLAINSLRRIPHWVKKGFSIDSQTYLSLLGVLSNSRGINS